MRALPARSCLQNYRYDATLEQLRAKHSMPGKECSLAALGCFSRTMTAAEPTSSSECSHQDCFQCKRCCRFFRLVFLGPPEDPEEPHQKEHNDQNHQRDEDPLFALCLSEISLVLMMQRRGRGVHNRGSVG
mmetsp:Transcript_21410/g.44807  ORF Transcript_21410/g.44807 Transcript_21410/m.44807 type:complete len:131 (-) Transcript_21410:483-875(-)